MKSFDENLYKTAQNRQSVPFAWRKIKTMRDQGSVLINLFL